MIDDNDAEFLTDYLRSIITPDEYENIVQKGYYDLTFGDDDDSVKAKAILCSKPVSEKMDALVTALSVIVGADVEINLHGLDEKKVKISEIGSKHIGKIVKIRAIINGVSSIKPVCTVLHLKCVKCKGEIKLEQTDPFKLRTMTKCPLSDDKDICNGLLEIQHEMSEYKDSQKISIQETPEEVTKQIPTVKYTYIFNKTLLDKFKSGDQVDIIGIVKVKFNDSPHNNRETDTYIEGLNVIPRRKDINTLTLTEDEIEKIKLYAKEPNIYDRLIDNLAPTIYGARLEKEAALLSLVGGVEKQYVDETHRRYWINVFLVGDPSTAKSAILEAASKLAPIGAYTGGRGVSAAGLTSAVVREKGSEAPMLIAGALPLCDRGTLAVDELDKIKEEDVGACYIAMENGNIPVSKGGFNTTLMSRTALLGAANPALGRYDFNRTVSENLKGFPIVLLSRFDLIFICTDEVNEEKDAKIADRVMENDKGTDVIDLIDRKILKNYIFYAKSLKPTMKPEFKEYIKNYYLKIRKRQSRDDPVPIAPRQLTAIIRITEAHAKLLLKTEVDKDDIDAAIKIVNASLEQTCKIIGEDGTPVINIDRTDAQLNGKGKEELVLKVLKGDLGGGMSVEEISTGTNGLVSPSEVQKIIRKMWDRIYEPMSGKFKLSC